MANVRIRVRDLRRVFREAAGFEPVGSWADELDDGRPLSASRFNVDVTCVSCGETVPTDAAEDDGWEHSYMDSDWRCSRCLEGPTGALPEADDMCDENDECGMHEADDGWLAPGSRLVHKGLERSGGDVHHRGVEVEVLSSDDPRADDQREHDERFWNESYLGRIAYAVVTKSGKHTNWKVGDIVHVDPEDRDDWSLIGALDEADDELDEASFKLMGGGKVRSKPTLRSLGMSAPVKRPPTRRPKKGAPPPKVSDVIGRARLGELDEAPQRTNRFGRTNQLMKCGRCGKQTTNLAGGINSAFCAKCEYLEELENEHSDGNHDGDPNSDCPLCQMGEAAPKGMRYKPSDAVSKANAAIQAIFKQHGIKPGPGEEAFWEAVEDVRRIDKVDARRLVNLARAWEKARAAENALPESAPKGKGWERLTKDLKKAKNVDNPFALAHSMKNKGYKPREQKR